MRCSFYSPDQNHNAVFWNNPAHTGWNSLPSRWFLYGDCRQKKLFRLFQIKTLKYTTILTAFHWIKPSCKVKSFFPAAVIPRWWTWQHCRKSHPGCHTWANRTGISFPIPLNKKCSSLQTRRILYWLKHFKKPQCFHLHLRKTPLEILMKTGVGYFAIPEKSVAEIFITADNFLMSVDGL